MKLVFVLVFALLVAAFTFLAGPFYQEAIESDLTEKVTQLFDKEGIGSVDVGFDHLHLQLSGRVENKAAVTKAVDVATTAWGAYVPDTSGLEVTPARLASFSARESEGALVLTGDLPDEAWRSKIVGAAKELPDVGSVDDQMVAASDVGDPAWGGAMPGLLNSLMPQAEGALLTARAGKLTLAGLVDSEEIKAGLLEQAGGTGLEIVDKLKVAEWSQPFASFERRGKQVEVAGLFPDAASQKAALAAGSAAADGAQVKNSTRVERRVRPIWWAEHMPEFVPGFVSGSAGDASVRYSPGKLMARASSISPAEKDRLEGLVGPAGDLFSADVAVAVEAMPDAQLIATRAGDGILLKGEVASDEEAGAIEAAVRAAMPDPAAVKIVNRLKAGRRAPLPNIEKVGGMFPSLFAAEVQAPRLTAVGPSVKVEGTVKSAGEQGRIGTEVKGLLADAGPLQYLVAVAAKPTPAPAPALDVQLESLAVYFKTGSAYIGKGELPKLEKAAKLLSSTSDSRLTVGGYADLRGNAESNRKLSLQRANAVREKLVSLGVPAARMTVQHFGEDTSEVAPSDLWKSRRVQVSLSPDS